MNHTQRDGTKQDIQTYNSEKKYPKPSNSNKSAAQTHEQKNLSFLSMLINYSIKQGSEIKERSIINLI